MSAFYDLASLVLVPSGYKASKVYAQKPLTTDGQLTFSRSTTATRVNSAGLIEEVAANVPRLDYAPTLGQSGVSCPRLILEPQATALNQFSEQIDNAYWTKVRGTVVANTTETIDPSGYYGADKLIQQSGFTTAPNFNRPSLGGAGNHTASVFVKKGTFTFVALSFDGLTFFDIENGTIGNTAAAHTPKIEDYGNGWYRCSVTNNLAAAATFAPYPCSANGTLTTPDTEGYAYFWGANVTATAYLQSYIPTLGAAVTRGADAASKTGISSLIGQTEGTFYLNFNREGVSGTANVATFGITDGSSNNRLRIISTAAVQLRILFQLNGNVIQYDVTTSSGFVNAIDQQLKIAVAYKSGDIAVYINGQLFNASSNTLTFSAPLTNYELADGANGLIVSESLLFKTRLPNAQLAELTQL